MNGYYGYLQSSLRRHGTWVAEIALSPQDVGIQESNQESSLKLFPNPVSTIVTLEIRLEKNEYLNFVVYDLAGKTVKVLLREYLKAGLHQFSFSPQPFESGNYILKVFNADGDFFQSRQFQKAD